MPRTSGAQSIAWWWVGRAGREVSGKSLLFASGRFLGALCRRCICSWLFELGRRCCDSWARTNPSGFRHACALAGGSWHFSPLAVVFGGHAACEGSSEERADVCPPRWLPPPAHPAQVCFSSCKDVKKANKTRASPSSSLIQCRTNEVGDNYTLGRGNDAWQRVRAPCGLAAPPLLEVCFAVRAVPADKPPCTASSAGPRTCPPCCWL